MNEPDIKKKCLIHPITELFTENECLYVLLSNIKK